MDLAATNATAPAGGPPDLYVNLAVVIPGLLGLVVSAINWKRVDDVKLVGQNPKKETAETALIAAEKGKDDDDKDQEGALENMVMIGKLISDGAMSFLVAEYGYLAVFTVLFSVVVALAASWQTAVAF